MSFPLSQDERIARFYDYWNGLRGDRPVPTLATFDPTEVGSLLCTLWKMRWEDERRDFVYRIAGEDILSVFPGPIRHKTLGEIYSPEVGAMLRERYQTICRTPAAFYARGQVYRHLGRYGTGERLVLPLSDLDDRVRIVIGCTVYSGSVWPVCSDRNPSADIGVSTFTTLDGEPFDRIKEAG